MTRSIVSKAWGQLRRLLRRVTLISAGWTASGAAGDAHDW